MLSQQMEEVLANTCNKSAPHPALGMRTPEQVSQNIQVISLGSSCGVKMTLRRMGLDQATMPFDWMRTSAAGINHWLRNGFEDFFRTPFRRMEVTFRDLPFTIYRTPTHSFWHDHIEEFETREKLYRRVKRFCDLGSDPQGRALLFVRSICGTAEVEQSEALYEALQQKFGAQGRQVHLLIVLDDQGLNGPIFHSKYPNLMFWAKPLSTGKLESEGDGPGPYEEAVGFACRRILRDPEALIPGGSPLRAGGAYWPEVSNVAQIFSAGGALKQRGLRDSEAGLWCGMVWRKNAMEQTMMCALEGYSHREIAYAN